MVNLYNTITRLVSQFIYFLQTKLLAVKTISDN